MNELSGKQLIEVIGWAEFKAQKYSGRGMYGSECVGFTAKSEIKAVAKIVLETVNIGGWSGELDEDIASICEALEDAQTDSMGLDTIIYFPRIQWPEDVSEGEAVECLACGEQVEEVNQFGECFECANGQ